MPLLLSEADVEALLTMPLALEAVEESFRRLAEGSAILHSRQRLHLPGKSYLHYLAAGDSASGYMGLKIYTSSREGLRFLIPLFSAQSGDLVALIEAGYLGRMRTGGATGVASRLLAREDARTIGIIGAGSQARTQLEAVVLVRKIEAIRVFSRRTEHRERFAKEMAQSLGVPVSPVASAEEALRKSDIVITATTATEPVVEGRWIEQGTHLAAVGANFAHKRELDADAVRRCGCIVVDSREQAREEAGDLLQVFGDDAEPWQRVSELSDLIVGKAAGRKNREEITLFKSNGIATEDIAVAARVYELARRRGFGRRIPLAQW